MSSTTTEKFVRDMLLKGRSVDFVSDASGYPREAVARIFQALRDERGGGTSATPADVPRATPADHPRTSAHPDVRVSGRPDTESDGIPESDARSNGQAPSLPEMREQARKIVQPRPEFNARATNAVELLARAADMEDRRVQAALGRARKAMTDLAAQVNRYESNDEARARMAELEEELRAIKASLRGNRPTKERENGDAALPCRKGCGQTSTTGAGRSAHERHCAHVGAA